MLTAFLRQLPMNSPSMFESIIVHSVGHKRL